MKTVLSKNYKILSFVNYIVCNFPGYIKYLIINDYKNNLKISLKDSLHLLKIIIFLKKHTKCQFNILTDMFGLDKLLLKDNDFFNLDNKNRFSVYYVLLSLRFNCRIFLEIEVSMTEKVITVSNIFKSAGWLEREIWDMFGIYFLKNEDLRRILTDYGFEGHPLRKDFPLSGFIEIRYDDSLKRIVYEPLEITQEFRLFDFKSPWEQVENIYN